MKRPLAIAGSFLGWLLVTANRVGGEPPPKAPPPLSDGQKIDQKPAVASESKLLLLLGHTYVCLIIMHYASLCSALLTMIVCHLPRMHQNRIQLWSSALSQYTLL